MSLSICDEQHSTKVCNCHHNPQHLDYLKRFMDAGHMKYISDEESCAEAQTQLKEPKQKVEGSALCLVYIALHQLFITFPVNHNQLTYKSPMSPIRFQEGLGFPTVNMLMYQAIIKSFARIYKMNLRLRCSASFKPKISLMMMRTIVI